MPAWLPVLKASLPYIAQIVTTAVPAFTSRTSAGSPDPLVARQIEELQTAVIKNAESIQVLAEKLQVTIEGIDKAALLLQRQVTIFKSLLFITFVIALVAIIVAYWALTP